MKKTSFLILSCLFIAFCLLTGCGKGDTQKKTFAKDWELVEFTVRGTTTKASELEPEVRKIAPAFRCEDGKNCVLSNNGKDHEGTITEENGQYFLSFGDSSAKLTAVVSGDVLTISEVEGKLSFVFKAVK